MHRQENWKTDAFSNYYFTIVPCVVVQVHKLLLVGIPSLTVYCVTGHVERTGINLWQLCQDGQDLLDSSSRVTGPLPSYSRALNGQTVVPCLSTYLLPSHHAHPKATSSVITNHELDLSPYRRQTWLIVVMSLLRHAWTSQDDVLHMAEHV